MTTTQLDYQRFVDICVHEISRKLEVEAQIHNCGFRFGSGPDIPTIDFSVIGLEFIEGMPAATSRLYFGLYSPHLMTLSTLNANIVVSVKIDRFGYYSINHELNLATAVVDSYLEFVKDPWPLLASWRPDIAKHIIHKLKHSTKKEAAQFLAHIIHWCARKGERTRVSQSIRQAQEFCLSVEEIREIEERVQLAIFSALELK